MNTTPAPKSAAEMMSDARTAAQSKGFSVVKDGQRYTLRLDGKAYAFGFSSANEAWTWAATQVRA